MNRSLSKWLRPGATATILFTSLAALVEPALADESQLQEVVVTASLGRNLLDVTQPTAVLSGDDLSRQLNGSLGETLSRQLGVSSSYFGPTASRPVIRGLGGYRVQTLQDGLSTLDVGGVSDDHATTIDPALAEQLEVIKGPATLLYGSGASGGLVNVVTHRIPIGTPTNGIDGMSELHVGTVADERSGVAAVNIGNDHVAMHSDIFKSRSGAIDIPSTNISARLRDELIANGDDVDTHAGSIPNAFSDTQGGAIGLSWLGQDSVLGGDASRYESTYGIPSEKTAYIDMQQNRYEAKAAWHASSGWLRDVSIDGAYNDYTHTEFEAPGVPGTIFNQDAYEVRAAVNHVHTDHWRGTFGAQLTHVDFVATGEEAFVPASITKSIGAFALEEFDVGRATFNVGARLERHAIGITDNSDLPNVEKSAGSFSAGAVTHLSDVDTVSVNVTHSARHPQATELYANGPHIAAQRFEIGDTTLDTEVANTIDASVRRHGDSFSWLLNLFYNDYQNFVFAAPTGNVIDELVEVQYRQSPAKTYGYETEFWAPLYQRGESNIRLRLMSDYVRGERSDGEPLPQMPPLRFGAGIHVDQAAWHAEVEAIHNNAQNRVATNELPTDGYLMLNGDVSYQLDAANGAWLFYLRGSNLLDEEARQHTSSLKDLVPLPGRAFTAGARLNF